MIHRLQFRTWFKHFDLKPTKLEIPGWAGEKTWEKGQPWHCKPWSDSATYGLELIYPFDTEVTVTTQDGVCKFECETDAEWKQTEYKQIPFSNFAANHFGFTSSLDIKTEPGYSTLIMPHPRFFTDMSGTVPLPSCGLLESDWWPKIFFIAFRAPLAGQKYVFRKGEGYAQIFIVPTDVQYQIEPMPPKVVKERQESEWLMSKLIKEISTKRWTDNMGQTFNNAYKMLSLLAKQQGPSAVLDYLKKLSRTKEDGKKKQMLSSTNVFFPRREDANTNKQ